MVFAQEALFKSDRFLRTLRIVLPQGGGDKRKCKSEILPGFAQGYAEASALARAETRGRSGVRGFCLSAAIRRIRSAETLGEQALLLCRNLNI